MGDRIDDVIEEITVDAYGDHKQLWSFRQAFEDEARFPLRGRVVGVAVEVASVDLDGDERRGLVAVCRRAGEVHKVSLLDVTPDGPLPLRTRQLFDAYRRWSGATPLDPISQDQATPWVYPRFASVSIDVSPPLALEPMGDWEPTEEYWGEPPVYREVRPQRPVPMWLRAPLSSGAACPADASTEDRDYYRRERWQAVSR